MIDPWSRLSDEELSCLNEFAPVISDLEDCGDPRAIRFLRMMRQPGGYASMQFRRFLRNEITEEELLDLFSEELH